MGELTVRSGVFTLSDQVFISLLIAAFELTKVGALYVLFLVCAWAVRRILRRDPDARPGRAILLACSILAPVWVASVNVSDELSVRIFWPLGFLGVLMAIVKGILTF